MTELEKLLSIVPASPEAGIDWKTIEFDILPGYAARMKATQQNPLYHAEGDVWAHTRMVCEYLVKDKEFWCASLRERQELFIAALLHDIGKIVTTKWQDGAWTSPNHAIKGAVMARKLLWKDYGLCGTREWMCFRETICLLVRYHMITPYAMEKNNAGQRLIKIAANGELAKDFTLKKLFLLSKADVNGKISDSNVQSEEAVMMAAALAQEMGCYERPLSFASFYTEYAFLSGRNVTPEAELYNDTEMEVIMLCGLPGTGKDTWIRVVYPDYPMVSLDNIRREHGLSPVGSQQEAVRIAREQMKELLRQKKSFVWNATSLTPELRANTVNLCTAYHAYVKMVFLETDYAENLDRNQRRRYAVPPDVIDKMLSKLVPPERFEAHEVDWRCV